jgi:DNA-binding GntR family transcriptional regulator
VTDMARSDVVNANPSGSLADAVYWSLRQDIVHGVLRPNRALVEAEIAERLQVSRTPVRESIQRLTTDGLVLSHRRRWVVYEHSTQEIKEIYEVRAALESFGARLASLRATSEQLEQLVVARHLTAAEDYGDDFPMHVQANEDFHDRIIQCAGNGRLTAVIKRNSIFHFNYRVAALYTPAELKVSSSQHDQLLAAVCDRQPDVAAKIAQEHVEQALNIILMRLH